MKYMVSTNKTLSSQWHPTKNGDLTPFNTSLGSDKKIWWLLSYDDPKTDKHFDFEWQATPKDRKRKIGCPYLTGNCVWPGFNDLSTLYPLVAKEWHPTKNNDLKPEHIRPYSNQIVWWYLPYDDPNTGKHFDFEWKTSVSDRTKNGNGCPYLNNKNVWPGYNDLQTMNTNLANEWHPTKNGSLTPLDVTCGSKIKVWWQIIHVDDQGVEHCFEWQATVADRSKGKNCPFISNRAVFNGYNDLQSRSPELAAEWDQTKNKGLSASEIVYGSHKKVWWKCSKGHSWLATVYNRYYGKRGCPHCAKSLRTSQPEQAIYYYIKQMFNDAKNGVIDIIDMELDIYIPSLKTAIEYDGRAWHKNIERDITKNTKCEENNIKLIRVREDGCPSMPSNNNCFVINVTPNNQKSLEDAIYLIAHYFNSDIDVNLNRDSCEILKSIEWAKKKDSLEDLFPEIANEWHPTKNGNIRPDQIKAKSNMRAWWYLPYDDPETGKHFDFEWAMSVSDRTVNGYGCPYLSNRQIFEGFNDLASTNPSLANEWNYEKNKDLKNKAGEDISTPKQITANSNQKVWWICNQGHEWIASVNNRNHKERKRGCPTCNRLKNQIILE